MLTDRPITVTGSLLLVAVVMLVAVLAGSLDRMLSEGFIIAILIALLAGVLLLIGSLVRHLDRIERSARESASGGSARGTSTLEGGHSAGGMSRRAHGQAAR
jgi:hypothetical protein